MTKKKPVSLVILTLVAALSVSLSGKEIDSPQEYTSKSYSLILSEDQSPFEKGEVAWKIQNPGVITYSPNYSSGVFYANFSILPGIEENLANNPVIEVAGAKVSFELIREPEVSNLQILVSPTGKEWFNTGIYYHLDANEYPEQWVDLTLKVDLESKTFDLHHGERLWQENLPLSGADSATKLNFGSLKSTMIKDVRISRNWSGSVNQVRNAENN